MRLSDGVRFWLLIAAALASHLALDSLNSYGIHPFYPFSNAWYFGDAIFILEPWLWLILGVAVVWNGRTRAARLIAAMPVLMLLGTAAATRIVPLDASVALGAAGIACAVAVRRLSAPTRAAVALVLCTGVVSGFAAASRVSRGAALRALAPELRGHVVDVILTPNPSSPLCWAVIAVELREASGEYVLWRGTLSLLPSWRAPAECASHRLAAGGHLRTIGGGRVALRDELHQPLRRLRTLAADDCWVRAWLQFGRAPVIDEGAIFDMRFSERIGQNFSRMRIGPREGCPRFVPGWHMPRADLLE
jgi:inner membrane protein